MTVAVMFGGKSVEHDVSIVSAIQAMEKFDAEKYTIYPVYITKNNEFYYGENLRSIDVFRDKDILFQNCERVVFTKDSGKVEMLSFPFQGRQNIICAVDIVFPIVHGTNVEDGILQGFIKTLDVPFVGCDVLSSAIGMDKYMMKTLLRAEGFPILKGKKYSILENYDSVLLAKKIESSFLFPVVVKPVNLGSSIGVSIAHSHDELVSGIELARKYTKNLLIEPAIVNLKEVNCSVLGNSSHCVASECEEPMTTHEFLDFNEKYIAHGSKNGSKGMKGQDRRLPADISDSLKIRIQNLSENVFKFFECCGVIRIDYMIDVDTNQLWLNEINTIPGSLAFYLWEASGISYPELLDRLIALGVERYEQEKDIDYRFDSDLVENIAKISGGGAFS